MYIKDPNSNRMYPLDSLEGRVIAGKEPLVQPSVEPTHEEVFNSNPFALTKDELLVLADGLDLKLTTRMKEGTMIKKINEHIENAGG